MPLVSIDFESISECRESEENFDLKSFDDDDLDQIAEVTNASFQALESFPKGQNYVVLSNTPTAKHGCITNIVVNECKDLQSIEVKSTECEKMFWH